MVDDLLEFAGDRGSGAEALQSGIPLATGQYATGTTPSTLDKILSELAKAVMRLGTKSTPKQLGIPALQSAQTPGLTALPPLDFAQVLAALLGASPQGRGTAKGGGVR